MSFHQKLVVYYILNYFGILLILDIKDFHRGIFVSFHQKLVVYYILDYFGISSILDTNSVLM